ncbi:amino acid ABC transporter substrate-binding protein [Methanosphaera sp. WGK6]|uniref:amino acid ABC transporter substrate-binding protein n=1 Tax=Methanosphaera sp. WGK6 TaxID=1561964 RepID=UPI00084C3457|nr:amino acid ABC transporter substrate-binding protein [Methanosphaera sp. WGK6]OED29646.1 ABC transporter substrate-binding protein [Methanosphaera sp. WGK6]
MDKKIGVIAAVIVIIVAILGLFGAGVISTDGVTGSSSNASAADNDDNTLVVGFDANFPPYGFKGDNGEYTGFDLDLAQEVCDRNNWTLSKQPIDWNSKDSELNSGTIDCIWNGFTINGREDQYTWTEPYINNQQVVVVKKSANINSLADLSGKIVEAQEDSSALAALEDNKTLTDTFQNLAQIAEYNTAFMDLDSGACDAIAMDIGVAQYQINSRNSDEYMIINETISSEQYGIGFKKGNTELRDTVQKTLNEMYEDGTIAKIAAKYDSYGVPGSLCMGNNTTVVNSTE